MSARFKDKRQADDFLHKANTEYPGIRGYFMDKKLGDGRIEVGISGRDLDKFE